MTTTRWKGRGDGKGPRAGVLGTPAIFSYFLLLTDYCLPSPMWPSPPLEHERYAHEAYLSCSTRSWPHPSLQHKKHVHGTCFSCLARSWTPTHLQTRKTRLYGRVFRVWRVVGPPHPTTTHNHDDNCTPAMKTTRKEREGGRTRYVRKFSFSIP